MKKSFDEPTNGRGRESSLTQLGARPAPVRLSRRSLLQSSGVVAAAQAQTGRRPPNIVFLISDDHTAADVGCFGNPAVTTPNLDRLANDGMRFTRCFVTSPQCSPNRSAILTGCTPHTTGTSRLHTPMPPWERTFLEPLKERGYFAGAFRKVHQGAAFDTRWDFYGDAKAPFESFFEKLPAGRPFFLHVGFTDPHRPYKAGAFTPPHDPSKVRVPAFLPDLPEVRGDLAHYYDAIARMDAECGQVLDILRRRGLEDNTLVMFTGDNGMPFPRAKGTLYDPGIHVPLIARWPGRIKGGGSTNELLSHADLAPTWVEAAGAAVPSKMQGRSFLNLMQGGSYQPRTEVCSERNWHDNFDPMRSIRTATHKLIYNAAPHFPYRPAWDLEDSPTWQAILKNRRRLVDSRIRAMMAPARPAVEMYDLVKDPHEQANLAELPEFASVRTDLEKRLSAWMESTYDYLPPSYAPGPPGRVWPASL